MLDKLCMYGRMGLRKITWQLNRGGLQHFLDKGIGTPPNNNCRWFIILSQTEYMKKGISSIPPICTLFLSFLCFFVFFYSFKQLFWYFSQFCSFLVSALIVLNRLAYDHGYDHCLADKYDWRRQSWNVSYKPLYFFALMQYINLRRLYKC